MQSERIEELLRYYREHTDQEFVKRILEALRKGELSDDEFGKIGDWIAQHSQAKGRIPKPLR